MSGFVLGLSSIFNCFIMWNRTCKTSEDKNLEGSQRYLDIAIKQVNEAFISSFDSQDQDSLSFSLSKKP